jgi:hypothetical protein
MIVDQPTHFRYTLITKKILASCQAEKAGIGVRADFKNVIFPSLIMPDHF